MNRTLTILMSAIALGFLSGCSSLYNNQATPVVIDKHMPPVTQVTNRNDPVQVIQFARTLSAEGRNLDAARIYIDAAKRFESVDNKFEQDCLTEAVREYWMAGEYAKANKLFTRLDNDQDIYRRAAEEENLARLRKLLNSGGAN